MTRAGATMTRTAAATKPLGLRPDLRLEKSLLRAGVTRLAAMDEVGRGALAGPVSVGVVVITENIRRVPAGVRDSKLLTPAARTALVPAIRRWVGEWAVGHASALEIDAIGIIAALRLAGRRALAQLPAPVDAVLLDGNHDYLTAPEATLFDLTPVTSPPAEPAPFDARAAEWTAGAGLVVPPLVRTRIKADMTCAGVAGASVLAKTERDSMLSGVSPRYPEYQFAENKGYGTPEHVAALRKHGPSDLHRRSWRLPVDTAAPADELE